MVNPIGTILKYGMLIAGAGLGIYVAHQVLVARAGKEIGGSISGFLSNVGEGTQNVGIGAGKGFEGLMTGLAGGVRAVTTLITDFMGWVTNTLKGPGYAPPPSGAEGGVVSCYHERLFPTTMNFRTIQYIREKGRLAR